MLRASSVSHLDSYLFTESNFAFWHLLACSLHLFNISFTIIIITIIFILQCIYSYFLTTGVN